MTVHHPQIRRLQEFLDWFRVEVAADAVGGEVDDHEEAEADKAAWAAAEPSVDKE